jgi:hypothetical protein
MTEPIRTSEAPGHTAVTRPAASAPPTSSSHPPHPEGSTA